MLKLSTLFATTAIVLAVSRVGLTPRPLCRDLIIPRSGEQCHEYQVTTEDGFELNVIHVPSHNGTGSPVVILQHGLLGSAAAWFDQQNNESLGYLLAKRGYDVWAPNSRGNWYSLTNKHWTAKQKELWDHVDYDLMAQYDLPAVAKFVKSHTGAQKVFYIGHSQGTTQAFAAFSKNYGDLENFVDLFIAYAPVAQVHHATNKAVVDMANKQYDQLVKLFGWASFPPVKMSALEVMEKLGVKCDSPDETLCENILYDMEGATDSAVNITQLKEDNGFDPAGTSMRNIEHWCQRLRNPGFAMFNYGLLGNLDHYGQTTPPEYDLSAIKVKMALFSGARDDLADPIDVAWLKTKLNPSYVVYQKDLDYAHNDFIWALSAKELLYEDTMRLMREHTTDAVKATVDTRRL